MTKAERIIINHARIVHAAAVLASPARARELLEAERQLKTVQRAIRRDAANSRLKRRASQ
jgi:hypothetical protein